MIPDALINLIYSIVSGMMLPIEGLTFVVDLSKLQPILQYFQMALYIIPFAQLMPIFTFFVALMGWRIVVSILRTIWDILPLV